MHRFLSNLFTLFLFLVPFACGVSAQSSFVYSNNHAGIFPVNTNTVSGFTVGADGVFREIPNSPFDTGRIGGFSGNNDIIVVGNHLYVGNGGAINAVGTLISPSISGFSIDASTGFLTPLQGSPYSMGGDFGFSMTFAATPDGRFFFVANLHDYTVSVFSIAADGSLVPIFGAKYTNSGQPISMKASPDSRFLAVADYPGLDMYKIESSGSLTLIPGSPFLHTVPHSVSSIDMNCEGTLLFAMNSDSLGTIEVFAISPTGSLTYRSSAPSLQGFGLSTGIGVLSPSSQYLFVSDSSVNKCIASFTVAQNGNLGIVPGSPFSIGTSGVTIESVPGGLATNNTGTVLYSSLRRNIIGAYSISGNGALSPVPGSAVMARDVGILAEIYALAAYPGRTCQTTPDFDSCIQDDSSQNLLRFNSSTGAYQFNNCASLTLTGVGSIVKRGGVITLQHNAPDRRVLARIDTSVNRATAAIQVFAQGITLSIADRNTSNNTCACPNGR